MKHQLKTHGWPNDKSFCDYARWWDCSFWCGNNKIFGKKLPHERRCPMNIPDFKNCLLVVSGLNRKKCKECGHSMKYHTPFGCEGAFPNGTKGFHPDEVFYGECLCLKRGGNNEKD